MLIIKCSQRKVALEGHSPKFAKTVIKTLISQIIVGVLIMRNLNKEDVENDDIEALESVDSNSKNSATENGRTTQ